MPDHPFRPLLAAVLLMAAPWMAQAQRGGVAPLPGANTVSPGDSYAPEALPIPMNVPSTVLDPNRKLQPGDVLSFKIEQDKEPPISLAVTHSGDLIVEPLDHAVHVAGLSPAQAGNEIKRQLEKDYYYTATVRLTLQTANISATAGQVFLSGAVARTGALVMYAEKPMKLSEAILNAGGFGRFANERKVQVTRPTQAGPEMYTVDVKSVLREGKLQNDMELKDKDSIFVPENFVKSN